METDLTKMLTAGKPMIVKKLGFMSNFKFAKYGKAIKLMDGTRSIDQLVLETKIGREELNDLIVQLNKESNLIYVDNSGKIAYEKLGIAGVDAYNLINGKRGIGEIAEAVGVAPEKLEEAVKAIPNVENRNGVLIKK